MNVSPQDVARQLFRNDGDSFLGMLVRLWQKGDPGNKRRLEIVFPEVCDICQEWHNSPSEDTFFQKYKVGTYAQERKP